MTRRDFFKLPLIAVTKIVPRAELPAVGWWAVHRAKLELIAKA